MAKKITNRVKGIPVISIVGTSNSGKTTMLSNLIPRLKSMGLRIGVIKHHGHRGRVKKSHAVSDTALFQESGADIVILAGPGIKGAGNQPPEEIIRREMAGRVDLVITEGYKNGPFAKIGITWPARPDHIEPDPSWIASIGGEFDGLPRLPLTDDKKLAAFISDWMDNLPEKPNTGSDRKKPALNSPPVSLTVNGREIDLNRFVSAFIEKTIRGMLSSLKGCQAPKETVIRIRHDR